MLLSNVKFKAFNYVSGDFYIRVDENDTFISKENKILIIKGYLYPDLSYTFDDLFDYFNGGNIDKYFKKFKGRYCGIYADLHDSSFIIFNDQLGLNDIFYYHKGDELILGDRFVDFFTVKEFGNTDLDLTALSEFLLYEHVFLDRTFIKDIKILNYATIKKIKLSDGISSDFKFWGYDFSEDKTFNKEEAMEKLDLLFKKSIERIHLLNKGKEFLIGLSGGLDSRLVAKYALQEGMKLQPFVFSNENSDAFYISQQIAKTLNLDLIQLVIKDDYWKYKDRHMQYDPMMNIMYTTYYSIAKELDKNKIMLTGFFGDNLFGSHIKKDDLKKNLGIINKIDKKYLIPKDADFYKNIVEFPHTDIEEYESIDIPDWQRKERFNFENRQLRFIKNSPSFDYYGDFENNFSIFADIDLVEYVLTLPLEELFNCKLYHDFISQYHPELANIRPERVPYYLSDHLFIKFMKRFSLKGKKLIEAKTGTKIPIFNTIKFSGALDWVYLFNQIDFDSEFKKINLCNFSGEEILELDNKTTNNMRIKYHYLTIQYFIERYIK